MYETAFQSQHGSIYEEILHFSTKKNIFVLYVNAISSTRHRVNLHSIVPWMSKNSFLETRFMELLIPFSQTGQTKCFWVWIPLPLLKLQISRLFWTKSSDSWHSGNYRVYIHSEKRTWHDNNNQYMSVRLQNKSLWARISLLYDHREKFSVNLGQNICRPFYFLAQFLCTTRIRELDYFHQNMNILRSGFEPLPLRDNLLYPHFPFSSSSKTNTLSNIFLAIWLH